MDGQIVGAVEVFAHELVGQHRFLAVFLDTSDAPVAVLAEVQPALFVHEQSVGTRFVAGLAAAGFLAGVSRRLQEFGGPLPFLPLHDDVVRDVRVQQEFAGLVPDRAFGPNVAVGDFFQFGVLRNQIIKPRIEAFDRSDHLGGKSLFRGSLAFLTGHWNGRDTQEQCDPEETKSTHDDLFFDSRMDGSDPTPSTW